MLRFPAFYLQSTLLVSKWFFCSVIRSLYLSLLRATLFWRWIHIRQRVQVCTNNHLKSKEADLGDKCHRLLLMGSCFQEDQQIVWSCAQVGVFLR
jgi:hypothetical protein